jgi:hypothetical protein
MMWMMFILRGDSFSWAEAELGNKAPGMEARSIAPGITNGVCFIMVK